jgi:hypothetical protein
MRTTMDRPERPTSCPAASTPRASPDRKKTWVASSIARRGGCVLQWAWQLRQIPYVTYQRSTGRFNPRNRQHHAHTRTIWRLDPPSCNRDLNSLSPPRGASIVGIFVGGYGTRGRSESGGSSTLGSRGQSRARPDGPSTTFGPRPHAGQDSPDCGGEPQSRRGRSGPAQGTTVNAAVATARRSPASIPSMIASSGVATRNTR